MWHKYRDFRLIVATTNLQYALNVNSCGGAAGKWNELMRLVREDKKTSENKIKLANLRLSGTVERGRKMCLDK